MPVTRIVPVNANTGAWTQISAEIPARSVSIIEDGSVAPQGLECQFPQDGFTAVSTIPYGQQPLGLRGEGRDGLAGLPGQNTANGAGAFNYRAADVYCQIRSATATATALRVVESEI